MIISIIIGPFFQQSVVFYSDRVPSGGDGELTAYASTALAFNGSLGWTTDSGALGYDFSAARRLLLIYPRF